MENWFNIIIALEKVDLAVFVKINKFVVTISTHKHKANIALKVLKGYLGINDSFTVTPTGKLIVKVKRA